MVKSKRRTLLFVLILLLWGGLSACLKKLPGPPLVYESTSGEVQDYLTARTGWLLARSVARKQASDARLVRVEGQWIDAGGAGRNWSYQFVSLNSQQTLVVQEGRLQLLQALKQAPAAFLDTDLWLCDSDAALARFALVQQLTYPMTSMILDADLIWRLSGPAGAGEVTAASCS